MLKPLDATINVIKDIKINSFLDNFKLSSLKSIICLASTTIKLEIAFIKVSILLTVSDIAKKTITKEIIIPRSLINNEKKAKSGTTLLLFETATSPVNPIIKTMGIIIKKEIVRLFSKILLFLLHTLFASYLDEINL